MANYEIIGLALLTALVLIPPALSLMAFLDWIKARLMRKPRRRYLLTLALIADAMFALCVVDAWLVEPGRLTVTRLSATSGKIASKTSSLRIVHISDVHFEQSKPLTQRLLSNVAEQHPDLIVLTGDVHQLGEYNSHDFTEFLTSLCSIAPTYGVTGYDDERVLRRASSSRLHIVDRASAQLIIRGTRIHLIGLSAVKRKSDSRPVSPEELLIALGHSPDGIPAAVELGAHWYFAGHTHGGQVRLPFWGAIVTMAETGKRYEYGHYVVGKTNAFVTRGIGLEPRPAPHVRFLCPPEVVVLTLTNSREK
jgi:predicted MPP superfamily phosphohydrolase